MDISSLSNAVAQGSQGKEETTQYIVVCLGIEHYGIDIRYIDNIVRMQRITRVPKMPDYLIGIINLRGEILPVVSLRLKMGLEADAYEKSTRIIILKTENEGKMGVIVDTVKGVVTLGESQVEKVEYDIKAEGKNFVSGVGKCENGELVSVLDLNAITLEENAQN